VVASSSASRQGTRRRLPAPTASTCSTLRIRPLRRTSCSRTGSRAVAIYAAANKGVFASSPDEPNGHTQITSGTLAADITVLDMGVLASLLFQNTPTGRLIETGLSSFDVFEELPATARTPTRASWPWTNVVTGDAGGGLGRQGLREAAHARHGAARQRSLDALSDPGWRADRSAPSRHTRIDEHAAPRYQREEMGFAPGEVLNQAIGGQPDNGQTENFFNGLCAECHGPISGRPVDFAVKPDLLTQASMVFARNANPTDLNIAPPCEPPRWDRPQTRRRVARTG